MPGEPPRTGRGTEQRGKAMKSNGRVAVVVQQKEKKLKLVVN